MKKAIPYYRVSTDRQGQSGLGLEAQQVAVEHFARFNHLHLLDAFTEIESGKNSQRPVLQAALAACREHKAVLVIARLDRLGRNVAFVSKLMESKVEFTAVDAPYASKLVVHIMAAFAEHESDQNSIRTKSALKIAKQRGVVLGSYGRDTLSKKNRQAANDFAEKMEPLIERLKESGFTTVRKITAELNRREVLSFRGKGYRWHRTSVQNLLQRLKDRST